MLIKRNRHARADLTRFRALETTLLRPGLNPRNDRLRRNIPNQSKLHYAFRNLNSALTQAASRVPTQ